MKKSSMPLVGLALLLLFTGCSNAPKSPFPPPQRKIEKFNTTDWATLLSRCVTPDGWVRYDAIENNEEGVRDNLYHFLGLIEAVSPTNRRDLFKVEATDKPELYDDLRLAYYINAYNAMRIYTVITHQDPASTVFIIGGTKMTLAEVLDKKIRSVGDPRAHFAVNDAARSSPKLRKEPYDGHLLQQQLADQGRRFLSDPYGAVRDGDRVKLSEIFKRYSDDFMAGYEKTAGHHASGLLQAIELYAASDSPVVGARGYTFMSFDDSLNSPPAAQQSQSR